MACGYNDDIDDDDGDTIMTMTWRYRGYFNWSHRDFMRLCNLKLLCHGAAVL